MKLSWLEISKKALLNNVKQIKKTLLPKVKFMAVVKANAYGHGLFEVVNSIKKNVDYLAVYSFEDALLLRNQKITKPLLVLGSIFPKQIDEAIKNNIEVTVSNFDILHAAKKISGEKKLLIHVCVDTGLGRDGFIPNDLKKIIPLLKNKNLEVKGLYSHFASADESSFDFYSKKQISALLKWKAEFEAMGFKPLIHQAASAGVLNSKLECHFDLVRVGLSLYGLFPSKEIQKKCENKVKLKPVLTWKAAISEIKLLSKGARISYGCTHVLKRDSKIAVLPVGYYDGISRVSSGKGLILVNGVKVPQIGRVTMNMIVIDITDVKKVKVGDVAIIIGSKNDHGIGADDWADWSQTSNYEIITRINSNLPRIVV